MYYEDIKLGDHFCEVKRFHEEDVNKFADLTKDTNPIHLEEEYAKRSIFKKRVVHGQFAASIFSMMFGTICPGQGAIYCSQNTMFLAPIYLDQDITFVTKVIDKQDEKGKITFETSAYYEDKQLIKGHAILKVQRRYK